MEWVIIGVVAAVLLFGLYRQLRRLPPPTHRPALEEHQPDKPPSVPVRWDASCLSAAEMLSRVHALQAASAQWDAIWSQLNPSGDRQVQEMLIAIRGPHMFTPHLGLGVIEDGCQRVLASDPAADALTALRVALHQVKPFV